MRDNPVVSFRLLSQRPNIELHRALCVKEGGGGGSFD